MLIIFCFSGVYHIYVDTDQEKNKLVGKYDNAGSFGELALMYNMPRAATIEAATEGSLWAMVKKLSDTIVHYDFINVWIQKFNLHIKFLNAISWIAYKNWWVNCQL